MTACYKHTFFLFFILLSKAYAVDTVRLDLGDLQSQTPPWQAQQVVLSLKPINAQQLAMDVRIQRLDLPRVPQPLNDIQLSCTLANHADDWHCPQGVLRIKQGFLAQKKARFSFHYQQKRERLDFALQSIWLADSWLNFKGWQQGKQWQVTIDSKKLALPAGLVLLKQLNFIKKPPKLSGQAQASLVLTGDEQVRHLNFSSDISRLAYSNDAGNQAMENLAFHAKITAQADKNAWQLQSDVAFKQGDVLFDSLFFTLQPPSVFLSAHMTWSNNLLKLNNISLKQTDVLALQAQGLLDFKAKQPVAKLSVALELPHVAQFQQHYLSAWLQDHDRAKMRLAGKVSVNLDKTGAHWQADSHWRDVVLHNDEQYQIDGLKADIHWENQAHSKDSQIGWQQIQLFHDKITLAANQLHLRLQQDDLTLQQPLHLPLLDGHAQVQQLTLRHALDEQKMLRFKAQLSPISLAAVMQVFDLPSLDGQISTDIPEIVYHQGKLFATRRGELRIHAFDGDVIINDLILTHPWQEQPVLSAQIKIDQLDLQPLTHFLRFGEITGRLSGHVDDLRLVNWQPVYFRDAYIGTPKNDSSRKYISQKAINNISSLGGSNVTAALSRSVLQIFERFAYKHIGWGCQLAHGVCQMRGVADMANGGYYLVEGRGLPRIDVKAYNRVVDWDELINRLKAATQAGEPTVDF
jgi:hypothetical protein